MRQKEKRNLFGYNASYNHSSHLGKVKFRTDTGFFARFDGTRNLELSNTINRYTVINQVKLGDIKELNIGVYVGETIKFNEKWSANIGLRFDQFLIDSITN